jgi:glutathione S-transferase
MKYGLDAPDVADAVATYHNTIVDMELALTKNQWLVGDEFSLADISVAPYFQTLYQFKWTGFYEKIFPKVTAWYEKCRGRSSYNIAVTEELSPGVLKELGAKGREGWPKLKKHLVAI